MQRGKLAPRCNQSMKSCLTYHVHLSFIRWVFHPCGWGMKFRGVREESCLQGVGEDRAWYVAWFVCVQRHTLETDRLSKEFLGLRVIRQSRYRPGSIMLHAWNLPNLTWYSRTWSSVESQKGVVSFFNMFHWEPEGRYRHRYCTTIVPFWFSVEHVWTATMSFWHSIDNICLFRNYLEINDFCNKPMLIVVFVLPYH